MILTDAFWKNYELDLAEIKVSYLNWAIGYAREPPEQYRHLFLWPEQTEYCIVNSRYRTCLRDFPLWSWCPWCAESLQKTHSAWP